MGYDRSTLHLADVDEVMIVVVGVVGREEFVGAGDVFSCCVADLVDAQVEVEENFVGGMVVIEAWKIGRSVRNEVSVVDYSVDSVKSLAHVVGKPDVSESRLAEVMNEHLCPRKKSLKLHCADRRNSSPQTMSSRYNTSSWVFLQQCCYSPIELLLEKQIIHIKPSMDLAPLTSEIRHLLKVSILYPILSVAGASEGEHDLIVPAVVAHVASCFGHWMLHVEGLKHWNGLAPSTGPCRYAMRATERKG